jgi:nucleoside-diphosphate-sugar epimerase
MCAQLGVATWLAGRSPLRAVLEYPDRSVRIAEKVGIVGHHGRVRRVGVDGPLEVAEGPPVRAIVQAALAVADRGVRSCLVMLPRSVHGEGERHGFIPKLIAMARTKGVSGYIGDGSSRWPAVHVKDAASLYRLAVEQAPAGAVLNAVGDEGVPIREIAEAIGRHLNLPAKSLPAAEYQGMLVHLLSTDMPASSTITQELLGWKPTHPGLIEDIDQGRYFI